MTQRFPIATNRAVSLLPTMHNLPSEAPGESGLPDVGASPSRDVFHGLQPQLLSLTLSLSQYTRQQIFTAFNLNLYYDPKHTGWYKRPDWFLVVGVPRLYRGKTARSSYVMWDEKVPPIVIVEFLSPATEAEDLGRFASKPLPAVTDKPPMKFEVYERILQVPHYVVYTEQIGQLRYFRLVEGAYQEQAILPTNPRLWIPELELGLGIWQGEFRDLPQAWLRWCDRNGSFIPTEAEAERAAKEAERAAKEAAQNQVYQGVLNLLQMGLTIAQVAQALGLSEAEVQQIAEEHQLK